MIINDLVSGGRSCAKDGRGVGEQSASGCAVDGLQRADVFAEALCWRLPPRGYSFSAKSRDAQTGATLL